MGSDEQNEGPVDPGSRVVTVVTGANTGIGFQIVRRLMKMHYSLGQDFIIVLACRNMSKAHKALEKLKKDILSCGGVVPFSEENLLASVQILNVDLSEPSNVMQACRNLLQRYKRIDRLVFNAGLMTIVKFDRLAFLRALVRDGPDMTSRTGGRAMIQKKGELVCEGLGKVFSSNVLGHYIMLHELTPLMTNHPNAPCRPLVIWMSSGTAFSIEKGLDINDIQALKSDLPYEHSKKLCEVLSVRLFESLKEKGILCYAMSPGISATDIVGSKNILRYCLVFLANVILKILGARGANVLPYYSAFAAVALAMKTTGTNLPESNNVYMSHTDFLFNNSVITYPIDPGPWPMGDKDPVIREMENLRIKYTQK